MAENETAVEEEAPDQNAVEIAALRAKNQELLNEAKRAKAALKSYEGVDPTEYKTLKQQAEEAEKKRLASEGDWKAIEKQLVDRHQSELTEREKRIDKLTKAIEKRAIRTELTSALIKAGAMKDSLDLLVEHGSRFGRLKETEDDFTSEIVEGGSPLVADNKGTPMDWDTLVTQRLKAQYPRLFEGTGSSGGGASKSAGGASGSKFIPLSELVKGDNALRVAKGELTVITD